MTGLLLVGTLGLTSGMRNQQYPEIQLWRNTDGNTYTRQASQEIRLAEGDFSPDGVLQYNLTTPISFQSGDVLGVYQPSTESSVVYNSVSSQTSPSPVMALSPIKWIVGAETGGGVSLPELQIWRNIGGTSYTKANFSILSSSTAPDNNNTVEYIPNPPLKFQEGDILGVYQPINADSALIVYNQEFDGPVNYEEGSNALLQ